MPRKSSIEELPPAILAEVNEAIGRRVSIDDIVARLRELGEPRSRSAVGRYSKDFAELAKEQRNLRSVAEAFGREFGSADDNQSRMMTQLITSLVTRTLIPLATAAPAGDDEDESCMTGLELSRLAKAAKDAVSASKIDIEREARIREEEAKRTRLAAAADAETAARAAGASEETLRAVRMGILGMAA